MVAVVIAKMSEQQSRLRYFPVAFFAMIMGLVGLAMVWERTESIFHIAAPVGQAVLVLAGVLFVAITLLYAAKLLKYPDEVVKEFRHPSRLSFFPTFSISLLLFSVALLDGYPAVSFYFWLAGAAVHLILTLTVLSIWMHHPGFEIQQMSPAWFIPVVGNILVPVAGVSHAPLDVSWFFFSIGLVFWLVLMTIIFYRVIFHHPLPERLLPTLFILLAPPAVGFISYHRLTGSLDGFARVLYFTALFLGILLLMQWRRFYRLKFFLSWWAYSFPVAALTLATLRMYSLTGAVGYRYAAYLLVVIVTAIISMLLVRTATAVQRREICVDEP